MTTLPDESETCGNDRETLDWGRLLSDHAPWMRCVVLARIGEAQAVEEVLQEIAVAAVAQNAPVLDPARVGPWLYRLVLVHAVRYRRGQARKRNRLLNYRQRSDRNLAREDDGGSGDPLQLLLLEERRTLTAAALRRLPGRDAELLMLKYGEQWSYQRIAQYLEITADAVDSRMHRARERLRAELKQLAQDQT